MASFCRSRDCFAAVRLASLRSCRRAAFSASLLARGRRMRFGGRTVGFVMDDDRGAGGMGADMYNEVDDEEGSRDVGETVVVEMVSSAIISSSSTLVEGNVMFFAILR